MTQTPAFEGSFTLFPAKEKRSDRSPDQTGTLELTLDQAAALADWLVAQPGESAYGGKVVVKLRLAGWEDVSRNGLAYIKGKVNPPLPPSDGQPVAAAAAPAAMPDDIPF